ncbi:helix-turn-helix transcriptional regulator [Myxococcus sp. CA051A]|uniref:helix-turn-helix domain-containing protein n=1 Tax=Myxococcus sp. CA051A TaxID=2741739 RepID=UPI00157A6521|nr:helix-turn-helix transcriptional regulator [Myxococcus sp. CA051A]NTX66451.1 helix-turn-helix transcriptional regulator [Myxococcus sp. CA051A]
MSDGVLRSPQVRALVRLVNEAHELPRQQDARSRHLLSGMCRILGADTGTCVLEHDFRPDGRGGFTPIALEGWGGSARSALEGMQELGSASNPAIRWLMDHPAVPGGIITAMRQELVDDNVWYCAPYVEQYLRPTDLDDLVLSCRWSELPGVVQGICLHRGRGGRPFDAADRELLHLFHAECGPLLGLAPRAAAIRDVRLAPRERQTLELLLRGLGDKEIAAELGISRFTVNQYTKAIYRRFGVRSRTALIAGMLGGGRG